MLQSIRLEDFKSFAQAEVQLAPLTVLVGANASGKSNLVDALRFVQGMGLGYSVLDTLQGRMEAGREVWRGIRGGLAGTVRHGRPYSRITTGWRLGEQSWSYEIKFETQPYPDATDVLLPETGSVPLDLQATSQRRYLSARPGGALGNIANLAPDEKTRDFSKAAQKIITCLSSSVLLTLSTERMRGYAPKQARLLGTDGEHLSSILWSLCQEGSSRQEWVDWLEELLAPELADIDFIETEIGDVMLTLVEADGTRTPARGLSDGTLRFLGTLVALRTAPPGSFMLMEEPETGLHPQRIHLLVEYLESVTRERNIQVIATTHSPQLLQVLSKETLRNAVLCARMADQPGTVLRRLGELPHFDEVSSRSHVDHLFTTGWLERAL